MSVRRKGRLPAWHLLTDEGGSVNSRFLSALFPSAVQAHAAAEVLERRGAVLVAMETDPRSTPQPLRRSQTWLDWTSLIVSAASVLLLALATICVPGVGYALALVALVTLTRVRPREIEHRLLVKDLTLSSGGALLSVSPGPLRSEGIIRLLQRHGAIDIRERTEPSWETRCGKPWRAFGTRPPTHLGMSRSCRTRRRSVTAWR
jgi:hypothetical protein